MGSAINNSPSICSSACQLTPVVGSPDAVPSTIPVQSKAALPGKSRNARNPAGRKRRPKKRGRPKRKAHALTSRYLRSHQPEKLRRTEVQKLMRADQFATRTGRHPGTFITLRWALTALREVSINRRWSALLNALRIWATRHGFEWTAIGVHENPPPEGSFNSHLLCNIPADLREAAADWLRKQLGGLDSAVDIRPRVLPGCADETLSYMLKGTDYLTAKRFKLIGTQGWKFDQGKVPFRRCTVSRNINAAAIAAWKQAGEFSGTIKKAAGEFRDQSTRSRKAA